MHEPVYLEPRITINSVLGNGGPPLKIVQSQHTGQVLEMCATEFHKCLSPVRDAKIQSHSR